MDLVCKTCGCELGALRFRTIVENDDSVDKKTKVFTEHDMACKNKFCIEFEKVQQKVRNEINLG